MSEALIGATIGLSGVIVGALMTWVKDLWKDRLGVKKRARYLATRVVCSLDDFFDQCTEVVADNGLTDPNDQDIVYSQIPEPDHFVLPEDVDWQSINHSLAYRILTLSNRGKHNCVSYKSSEDMFQDDWNFDTRRYRYACLGLEIAELAQTLRKNYKIPYRKFEAWDPLQFLKDKKLAIEQQRRAT